MLNRNSDTPKLVHPPSGVMQTEPETTWGAIIGVVMAGVALAVGFGLEVSSEQQALILAFLTAVAAMATALGIRPRVYSERSAQKVANIAAATGDATIQPPPAKDSPNVAIANGELVARPDRE